MSTEFLTSTMPPPVGYSHVAKVNKGNLIHRQARCRAVLRARWPARAIRGPGRALLCQRQLAVRGCLRHHGRYRQRNPTSSPYVDPAEIQDARGPDRYVTSRSRLPAPGRVSRLARRLADRGERWRDRRRDRRNLRLAKDAFCCADCWPLRISARFEISHGCTRPSLQPPSERIMSKP